MNNINAEKCKMNKKEKMGKEKRKVNFMFYDLTFKVSYTV